MRPGRIAIIILMVAALAAPTPAPSAEAQARAQMEQGVSLEQAGRYGEAVDQLSQALTAKSLSQADTARALFDRGVAYDGLGNMRAAVGDYTAALTIDPALAPALNNRANAYRRNGQMEEAKRDYWAALKCAGQHEYPYYGLGLIALNQGDTQQARDYFQQALAANPSFAPAAKSLADIGTAARPPDSANSTASAEAHSPPPDAPEGTKTAQVQLGAYQSEAMALAAWQKIAAASGELLQGLKPVTLAVEIPRKGRLWRLRATVSDASAARKLCQALQQHGQACLLPRS